MVLSDDADDGSTGTIILLDIILLDIAALKSRVEEGYLLSRLRKAVDGQELNCPQ